jgi:nitrogen regulatory protein PII
MHIKRITTIVPADYLERMEQCLCDLGVPGMTIDNVRGFGEHANLFSNDLLRRNVRIEVYIGVERCDELCGEIRRFTSAAHPSAGILVVESVERIVDLNSGKDILPASL